MNNGILYEKINKLRHGQLRNLYQSLKAHITLSYNRTYHINASILRDLAKRIQAIEQEILSWTENNNEK